MGGGRDPRLAFRRVSDSRVRSYEVSAESTAPPAVVWALLLDPRSWPAWSRIDALEPAQSQDLSPDGRDEVGAIRAFRTGKVVTRERITGLEPETRFAYEGVDIVQMDRYKAAIVLHRLPGGGTRVHWYGSYLPRGRMPWFFAWYLRRFMQSMATGLAEHAARLAR